MFKLGTIELPKKNYFIKEISSTYSSEITPWGVSRVRGPLDGTGKTAWILDTGIDLDHSDLNVDVDNSVSFIADESANDIEGHGTHVAGILAAINNDRDVVGVAAGATVIAVKVCDSSGCPEPALLNGIDYVSIQAAPDDIVNMSIWGPTDADLDNAVLNAANNGVRFALIAGNAGADANNYSPGRVNHSNVWTISAYDDTDTFASFSNYGNPPIEYGGPGVDVPSLDIGSGVVYKSGTSMAAPHIAGLLLAAPQGLTVNGYVNGDPDGESDPIAVAATLTVAITGPGVLNPFEQGTWTANAEFGSGDYSYQWYYTDSSTDSWIADGNDSDTYSHTFYQTSNHFGDHGVRVVVTSGGEQAEDPHNVSVVADENCAPGELCEASLSSFEK